MLQQIQKATFGLQVVTVPENHVPLLKGEGTSAFMHIMYIYLLFLENPIYVYHIQYISYHIFDLYITNSYMNNSASLFPPSNIVLGVSRQV